MKTIQNLSVSSPVTNAAGMSMSGVTFDVYEDGKLVGSRGKGLHAVPATMQDTFQSVFMAAGMMAQAWLDSEFPPMLMPMPPQG